MFGVHKFGRLLLGDEMGVGKTVQAIAIQYWYRNDWPLLIVCPSSLKYTWRDELLRWVPMLGHADIQLFSQGKEPFKPDAQVFIISYDLATRKAQELKALNFNSAIADEAHYLKSYDSKRSRELSPILGDCKRIILVTGTPMISRPSELYNLVRILRPDLFGSFREFSQRYCAPKMAKYGMDYKGASCTSELHFLMKDHLMIRRLKEEVLSELPSKTRQRVQVQVDPKVVARIKEELRRAGPVPEDGEEAMRSPNYLAAHRLTGEAKV